MDCLPVSSRDVQVNIALDKPTEVSSVGSQQNGGNPVDGNVRNKGLHQTMS